jgi:hypothetical protein
MSKIFTLAFVMIAFGSSVLSAQTQQFRSKAILLHVTSVERAHGAVACKSGSCSAMKYTVDAYADAQRGATKTEFVITCNELMYDLPRPHRDNICARFHAGNVYFAHLQSDSISFPHSMLNKDFETDYRIVSEKEVALGPEDRLNADSADPRVASNHTEQPDTTKNSEQVASRGTH